MGVGLFNPSRFLYNPSSWGTYGPSLMTGLGSLNGPNIPGMAGRQAETSAVDQAGTQYQDGLESGRSNLAARGLSGSGADATLASSLLSNLQGGEAQAAETGTGTTQQLRDQLRMMILNQLQQIAAGRAGSQGSLARGDLGSQIAGDQGSIQNLGIASDIFGNAMKLGNTSINPGSIFGDIASRFGAPASVVPWLNAGTALASNSFLPGVMPGA